MLLENIKHLCKKNGTSVSALEKSIGIGNGVIGKWVPGISPRVDTVKAVADYFGVTVDDLLNPDETQDNAS